MDAATMAEQAGAATAGMVDIMAGAATRVVVMRGMATRDTAMLNTVTLDAATIAAVRSLADFTVMPVADFTAAVAGSTVEGASTVAAGGSTEVAVDAGNW
jgi:hypothetical protein